MMLYKGLGRTAGGFYLTIAGIKVPSLKSRRDAAIARQDGKPMKG